MRLGVDLVSWTPVNILRCPRNPDSFDELLSTRGATSRILVYVHPGPSSCPSVRLESFQIDESRPDEQFASRNNVRYITSNLDAAAATVARRLLLFSYVRSAPKPRSFERQATHHVWSAIYASSTCSYPLPFDRRIGRGSWRGDGANSFLLPCTVTSTPPRDKPRDVPGTAYPSSRSLPTTCC